MEPNTKKVIVTYSGAQYDLTSFVGNHPGGRSIIEKRNGQDITASFLKVGHSNDAKELLKKYRIGEPLKEEGVVDAKTGHPLKKLFTEEDHYFFHKTFGLLSVLHFAYRYLYVWPTTGTLGFEQPTTFNLVCLAIHMMLSSSSLIFHVLEKRIAKNPLIIYEEYRLHAIVFTLRAIGVSVIGMYMHLIPVQWQKYSLCIYVLGMHILVDLITKKHGTPGITAVRNRNEPKMVPVRRFFSYYQFLALASHLLLDDHLCDLGWNAVVAIQSSAFLMTLKRKSLIRWHSYMVWYGGALILSSAYMWQVKGTAFMFVVAFCFWVRATFNTNKYLLWPMFVVAYYISQGYLQNNPMKFSDIISPGVLISYFSH